MNHKKITSKKGICIDNFGNDIVYKYEYKGKYFESCLNGNLINNSTIKSCYCDDETCSSCPNEPIKENLCIKCNNNSCEIENDNLSFIEGYVKCYKNPKGYYLDKNIYKKRYYTCETCEMKGDNIKHNCLKCNDN